MQHPRLLLGVILSLIFIFLVVSPSLADHNFDAFPHWKQNTSSFGLIEFDGESVHDPSGAAVQALTGAITAPTVVAFRPLAEIPFPQNTSSGYRIVKAIEVNTSANFAAAVQVQMTYGTEIGGAPESQIRGFVYNDQTHGWEAKQTLVDPDNNLIVFNNRQFSPIGLGVPVPTGFNTLWTTLLGILLFFSGLGLILRSRYRLRATSILLSLALLVGTSGIALADTDYTSLGNPVSHDHYLVDEDQDEEWLYFPASKVETETLAKSRVDIDDFGINLVQVADGKIVSVQHSTKTHTYIPNSRILREDSWAWLQVPGGAPAYYVAEAEYDEIERLDASGNVVPKHTKSQRNVKRRYKKDGKVVKEVTLDHVEEEATSTYNCAGKVFSRLRGRGNKNQGDYAEWEKILEEDYSCLVDGGKPKTAPLKTSDTVVYKKDKEMTHFGHSPDGVIIQSKWGKGEDYLHKPDQVSPIYGAIGMICRLNTDDETKTVDRGKWVKCDKNLQKDP